MAEIEEGYEDVRRFFQSALLDHEWEPGRRLSVHRLHRFDGRCSICLGDVASMVVVLLGAIEHHRHLTVRHYAPTQWAYDQACKALHEQRERAEKAEAKLAAVSASEGEAEEK